MCISIPVYSIYLQVMSNLHTHTLLFLLGVSFILAEVGKVEGIGKVWNEYESSLHWNHLNLVFLDKYFTFNLNILEWMFEFAVFWLSNLFLWDEFRNLKMNTIQVFLLLKVVELYYRFMYVHCILYNVYSLRRNQTCGKIFLI